MSSDAISVNRRLAYSAVPDAVLEHPALSFSARTTLGWMLGRPAGWEIRVGYMLKVLRLTDKTWKRTKRELIREGFFSQRREKGDNGKFVWFQEVTDAPLFPIPPKRMDGNCSDAGVRSKAVHLEEHSNTKAAKTAAAAPSRRKDCGVLLGVEYWSTEERKEIEVLAATHGSETVRQAAQRSSADRPDGRVFLSAIAPLIARAASAEVRTRAVGDFDARRAGYEATALEEIRSDVENLEKGRQFLRRRSRCGGAESQ